MSDSVKDLQAQAAKDYADAQRNSAERQAEARNQSAFARIHGHEAAGSGSQKGGRG